MQEPEINIKLHNELMAETFAYMDQMKELARVLIQVDAAM